MVQENPQLIPLDLENTWQIVRGDWKISKAYKEFSFIGYSHKDDPNPDGLCISDLQISDGIFEAEVKVKQVVRGDTNAHLVFRYDDYEQYLFAGLGGWDSKYVIAQRTIGESALRKPGWAPVNQDAKIEDIIPNHWYKIKVDFSGPNIDLYVGNVCVLRYTSSQRHFIFPPGNIGFRGVRDNLVYFRNPSVKKRISEADIGSRLHNIDLSFVNNENILKVVERDLDQVKRLNANEVPKASVVLLGSIAEGILLDVMLKDETKARNCKSAKKNSIKRWNFETYIDVARELGSISDVTYSTSHTLRGYRNLIHPGKQEAQELAPWSSQAVASVDFLISLIKDVSKYQK